GSLKDAGDIARHVVGPHGNAGSQQERVAVVHHEIRGVQSEIDQRGAASASFGAQACVGGGDGFKDRFLDGQVGHVGGGYQGVVFPHIRRDDVNVRLQTRAHASF